MKNLLNIFFSLVLLSTIALAQENIDLSNTQMPTDEEIRQTIEKYDFNPEQKEHLFKETKKRLEDLYNNKDFAPIIENQGQNLEEKQQELEKHRIK